MMIDEYAPATEPTLEQQRHALRNGLGRSLLWAQRGKLADEPLLAACLSDQRYDRQLDRPRAGWLWRLIEANGAMDRFREPIWNAIAATDDERVARLLCGFAQRYAERGEERFLDQLYEIVECPPFDDDTLGVEEIIAVDGYTGFLFAVEIRGETFANREWNDRDDWLIGIGIDRFGKFNVNRCFAAFPDNADIQRFCLNWRAQPIAPAAEEIRQNADKDHAEFIATSVHEVVKIASTTNGYRLSGWGREASATDLRFIWKQVNEQTELRIIASLLRVFSHRTLPDFDPRLLDLCHHPDAKIRHAAWHALKQIAHDDVRAFALRELQRGTLDAVALFEKNYQPGDENLILDNLHLPSNDFRAHGFLSDAIDVLRANPSADCLPLATTVYVKTPCGICRRESVRLLMRQGIVPQWILDEYQYDSDFDADLFIDPKTVVGDAAS